MQSREELQRALEELKSKHGEWAYDIPLPFNVWTKGNLQVPHTRLKRIVQVVSDLSNKPLSECRILDLGCLDGIYSIEFAKHGADTIGVEIREANIRKAIFCKEALALHNVDFRQDDVRNISAELYGRFDAIVCSGILYHLPATDAIDVIKRMYDMVNRVVVIDTHVALKPIERFVFGEEEYWGSVFREHSASTTPEEKAKTLWASADNPEHP
jgi:2-polyprenyl-3-methyl-5-hydroxy-6-metoxy-1,4-benzoquinol methylase